MYISLFTNETHVLVYFVHTKVWLAYERQNVPDRLAHLQGCVLFVKRVRVLLPFDNSCDDKKL